MTMQPMLWILLSLAGGSQSARILAVLPFPARSHFIFFSPILKALVERGHQVVEYSPFPPGEIIQNYIHVEVHTSQENSTKAQTYETFIEMFDVYQDQMQLLGLQFRKKVWAMTGKVCEDTFKHENIQKLLNSEQHFDIVMTESTFGQESMVVFGHKFRAPTITLQALYTWCATNRDAGNDLAIASIPYFLLAATNRMSFLERLSNLLSTSMILLAYHNYNLPMQERIMKQHYNKESPPLSELVRNISLYLVNVHPTVHYPQPYSPNIIPIGGNTITPERTSLPKNIKSFLDNAKEGVIFFSLGTVVPSHLFPNEILKIFVNVFKKLSYKVLWKIDLRIVPGGLPKNVMLTKWAPQLGVLGHPNCVLFITHGGLLSLNEAIYTGVPTVAIPFYGDQPYNVKFIEDRGIGVKLDIKTISEETVHSSVNTVITNSKYRENAEGLSRIYRDQPLSPTASAVFWVEYVLRHRGAPHLRPTAAQLSWYQLAMLDVFTVVLFALIASIIMLYLAFSTVLSLMSYMGQHIASSNKKIN